MRTLACILKPLLTHVYNRRECRLSIVPGNALTEFLSWRFPEINLLLSSLAKSGSLELVTSSYKESTNILPDDIVLSELRGYATPVIIGRLAKLGDKTVYARYNTISNITSFFSSVMPKMIDSSEVSVEPLSELAKVEATAVINGVSYSITNAKITASIMLLVDTQGRQWSYPSNYKGFDTVSIRNMVIEGQQPSLEVGNLYPITKTDGTVGSSVGSESRKFDVVWSDYLYGVLNGYLNINYQPSITQNAIMSRQSLVIGTYLGGLAYTLGSGTITLGNGFARLFSGGTAEISFKIECADDTIGYVYVPFLFSRIYSVHASAYREAMIPTGNTWPGLSGTGKSAQFDALDNGVATPGGSSHQWTRILIMNDYEAISGYVTVTGILTSTQYQQIINNGGNLSFLFDI